MKPEELAELEKKYSGMQTPTGKLIQKLIKKYREKERRIAELEKSNG